MKIHLAIILSLSILSCKSQRDLDYRDGSINSLVKLEKELYSNPSTVLDFVSISNETISDTKSQSYATLLYAIAHEQKYGIFNNDSIIKEAAKEFQKNRDNFNYSRALLYTSIAQYTKDKQDSAAFHNILLAQNILKKEKRIDHNLNATLYLYLGRLYRLNANHNLALEALQKSLEQSSNASNNSSMLCASLEIFNLKLISQEYGEALNAIACFGDVTELPAHIAYALYNSMYNYYSAKRDPQIAIEYLKKILQIDPKELKINTNTSKTYFQLASTYKRINKSDSSLYYAQAAVNSIVDSSAQESHFYYRYLADILYSNKEYKRAAEFYKNAHFSYIVSFTRFSQQRELEIKAKFNLNEKEKQINSIKTQRALAINILFILTALLILVSLSYFFYTRKNKELFLRLNQELDSFNKEVKKRWLISEIYKTNSYVLPLLIESVSQEAARSRKISKEMYDSLNKIIDTANSSSRSSLADITNHEEFANVFAKTDNLDVLTDFEKLVYALNKEGYSNSEIANFLNSSQSSIRTIKGKISRKLLKIENEIETEK